MVLNQDKDQRPSWKAFPGTGLARSRTRVMTSQPADGRNFRSVSCAKKGKKACCGPDEKMHRDVEGFWVPGIAPRLGNLSH